MTKHYGPTGSEIEAALDAAFKKVVFGGHTSEALTAREIAHIHARRHTGGSARDIARELNRPLPTIQSYLVRKVSVELTEERVAMVIACRERGVSLRETANTVGLSPTAVSKIERAAGFPARRKEDENMEKRMIREWR